MTAAADTAAVQEIAGTVTRLFCQKPTFTAGEMTVRGRDVKFAVKGYVTTGPVTLRGSWQNSKYGRQFAASEVVYTLPTNPDGLAAWLQWYADGLGPVKSQKLLDEFGMTLMLRVCDDPQQVAAAAGIPIEFVNRLAVKWTEHSGRVAAATQFAAWGCTQAQTEAILGRFGGSAVQLVQDDPYAVLGRVDGFGWQRSDELAAKVGVTGDDPRRLRGAVSAVVRERYDAGHTATPLEVACLMAADKVGKSDQPTADKVAAVIDLAVDRGLLRKVGGAEGMPAWVATRGGYEHEAEVWKVLARSRDRNPHGAANLDPAARVLAQRYASLTVGGETKTLDAGQLEAVAAAAAYRISVVTGGAGAGKTLVARAITKLFLDGDVPVSLCAPTGKAARRLEEVIGKTATTIHRLLEYCGGEGRFTRNADNPLPPGVVICDECFPWKQRILTESGWEYIGKIVERRQQVRVYSRNPATGALELKPVVGWMKKPAPATLLRIDASRSNSKRGARVIRCTHSHKVLTPTGYVRADALKVGDEVMARGPSLTTTQMSVLVGSIFGDAGVCRHVTRVSPQVTFMQGEAQADYLEFKREVFGSLAAGVKVVASGYPNGRPVHNFTIGMTDECYGLAAGMIPDGHHPSGRNRWRPSPHLLNRLDAQALCTMFLDNGSVSSHSGEPYASLHTERFSVEANQDISDHLFRRFGIRGTIQRARKTEFVYLRFSKAETQILFDTIRPFVPACMAWKVEGGDYTPPTEEGPGTHAAVIRSVVEEPFSDNYAHVYDIEVKDHHNYVAGNVVVSNCSMVDAALGYHLLSALGPDTALVLIGDPNQLPPVGPGALLRDVLAHDLAPVTRLENCHRQAGTLKRNCNAVLRGEVPPWASDEDPSPWVVSRKCADAARTLKVVAEMYSKYLPLWGYDPVRQTQFMTARHDGQLGTRRLNLVLQHLHQTALGNPIDPPGEDDHERRAVLYTGDKVIQGRNNYEKEVMNGTIGVVKGVGVILEVEYPDKVVAYAKAEEAEVSLAYCLTPHRMQGSEIECAVTIVPRAHGFMQHRNWFYTAVTRAKRTAVVIGDDEGIRRAAERVEANKRETLLQVFATTEAARP